MSIDDRMFVTIHVKAGRMYPCKHMHATLGDALACPTTEHAAIIEWQRDRAPQFLIAWVAPDLDPELAPRLGAFTGKLPS